MTNSSKNNAFYILEYEKAWELVGLDFMPKGMAAKISGLGFEVSSELEAELNKISSYLYLGHAYHENKGLARDNSQHYTTFIVDRKFQHGSGIFGLDDVNDEFDETATAYLRGQKSPYMAIVDPLFTKKVSEFYSKLGYEVVVLKAKKLKN